MLNITGEKMERFLVTGAMGFVGSHWCEYLLKKGKKVYGLDLAPHYPKLMEYKNFIFIHDTIKNYNILKTAVDRVDCVCHFAGIAEPDQYVKAPRKVIDITAIAGIKLIEMCRLSGKLFFFTSTSEIYGKNSKIPFKEDDDRVLGSTATKRWCYSTSKALLEHYLDACAYSNELNHVTVRLFNVYGPRLKGRVIYHFLQNAFKGDNIIIHGEGKQTRSFTYIDEVIDAFDRLIHTQSCHDQIFNIGHQSETSINELAVAIKKVGAFKSQIKHIQHEEHFGKSYEDIPRRVPDISKIIKYTGWEPSISLEDGLSRTIKYFKGEMKK